MNKAAILTIWLFGMVVVIAIASLAGYISIVLDSIIAFVGAWGLTYWALRKWFW